ncbi:hypothetical protein [Ideonella sp. A 288]|uniref:hypothetical protein n=1 Tax=Ideonella sp. A 288 TaxID=1962181 RepID=UPI001184F7A2|nr:hypothetical protein [Ideonella sp. A 288]
MKRMSSLIKLATLAALGISLSGCIVLPWGGHRHGGHGGYRHLSATQAQPAMAEAPRGSSYARGQ